MEKGAEKSAPFLFILPNLVKTTYWLITCSDTRFTRSESRSDFPLNFGGSQNRFRFVFPLKI